MKAFRFSLDRVLHIRRAQLEVERAKLSRIIRDREQLDAQSNSIQLESAAARTAIVTQPARIPGEMATMPDYQRGAKQRLLKLSQQRQELLKRAQEQQRVTVEAERKVKLLERLREKHVDEWESAMTKELEDFAADAYLSRWTVSS